jgi:MoxR-like ATPase
MSDTARKRPRRRTTKNAEAETRTPSVDWQLTERVLACELIRSVFLFGPAGTGKTHAGLTIGLRGRAAHPFTLTQEMPLSDLCGGWKPRGSELCWVDGPVATAMRNGGRVVANEPAHASEEIVQFFYGVIESLDTARITLPNGEMLAPAPEFQLIMTSNEPPEALPGALRDRLETVIEIREPHPTALARLSPDLREAALRSFDLETDPGVSLRGWLKVDELRPVFGIDDAFVLVFGAERGSLMRDAFLLASRG